MPILESAPIPFSDPPPPRRDSLRIHYRLGVPGPASYMVLDTGSPYTMMHRATLHRLFPHKTIHPSNMRGTFGVYNVIGHTDFSFFLEAFDPATGQKRLVPLKFRIYVAGVAQNQHLGDLAKYEILLGKDLIGQRGMDISSFSQRVV